MDPIIRSARMPEDLEALELLFAGYLAFLIERAPEERAGIESKYPLDKVREQVAGFVVEHARPTGQILIAELNGEPVGCAMMRQMEPGIVEIQRVFVADAGRGKGIGKAMTLAMMDQARADGQRLVRLDTGVKLTEAIGLYRAMGFRERDPYHNDYPALQHLLVFFEAEL